MTGSTLKLLTWRLKSQYSAYDLLAVRISLQPSLVADLQGRKGCDLDARHSVHSVRNREGGRDMNRSLSARAIIFSWWSTSLSGRKTGLTSAGVSASSAKAVLRCPRASPIS